LKDAPGIYPIHFNMISLKFQGENDVILQES